MTESLPRRNLESSFAVNVLGVHHVTQAFFPLLQKGNLKKVANISTTLGSIDLVPHLVYFPAPAYKITKAATNPLTVQWALDHEKDGFTFIAICPGVRVVFPTPSPILSLLF